MEITKQEVEGLLTYLGEVPSKWANPIISFLQQKLKKEEETNKPEQSEEKEVSLPQ